MTKYVESGREAFAWIQAQLAKNGWRMTEREEMALLRTVQKKFGLSGKTAALLLRDALESRD